MSAITAAVTAAKSTIDRLLSNGNADPKSCLIRNDSWKTYSEDFDSNEISVNYRREGETWIYTVTSDTVDSTFFSKTGTARTLKEARLEALDAAVAGCTAQEVRYLAFYRCAKTALPKDVFEAILNETIQQVGAL